MCNLYLFILPLDKHKELLQPTGDVSLHLQAPQGYRYRQREYSAGRERRETIQPGQSRHHLTRVCCGRDLFPHSDHPQHQPQRPSLIDCTAQGRSRSSQKTAKTPRQAGLLKQPFPFLPCPWTASRSRQQAPK